MRLEVLHLTKTYKIKKQDPLIALNDVSLLFPEKGMVFLLGKSGSGKSTLLNVIGGLDSFDEGEIIINGRSSKEFTPEDWNSYRNTYLGFVFQDYNTLDDFNVKENISLALGLQNQKADETTIAKIMDETELTGLGNRKPNELSGGQRQRVAIARALVKDPKIILADEPTGALDEATGKAVFDTLKKMAESRLVIVVSHDREFAESYGDRVIEMKDGKLLSDLSKDQEGKFASTENEKITAGEEEWQAIKSSFPLKNAVKMGARAIKSKPVKLLFTIILSCTSFSLLGITSTLGSTDRNSYETNALKENETRILDLNSKGAHSRWFGDLRLGEAKESFGSESVHPYVSLTQKAHFYGPDGSAVNNPYYLTKIERAVAGSERLESLLGFQLECGHRPSNRYEIALTDYFALAFQDFGYKKEDGTFISPDEFKVEDLLGMKFNDRFTISGIYKTNIKERLSKFTSLKGKYDASSSTVADECKGAVSDRGFDFAFLSEDGLASFIEDNRENYSSYCSTGYTFEYDGNTSYNILLRDIERENVKVKFFDKNKTTLGENEFAVSERYLPSFVRTFDEFKNIAVDPFVMEGYYHEVTGESTGYIVNTKTTATSPYGLMLEDVVYAELAFDKKDDYPYDYPDRFMNKMAGQGIYIRYDENERKFYDRSYGTEFDPLTSLSDEKRADLIYNAYRDNGFYNILNDVFTNGFSEVETTARLPYFELVKPYRERIKAKLDADLKEQGFGVSVYYSLSSSIERQAEFTYTKDLEKVNRWWNGTKDIAYSFVNNYILYKKAENADFDVSSISDDDKAFVMREFFEGCIWHSCSYDSHDKKFSPNEIEQTYYDDLQRLIATKKAENYHFIEGSKEIELSTTLSSGHRGEGLPGVEKFRIVGVATKEGNFNLGTDFFSDSTTISKYSTPYDLDLGPYGGAIVETPTTSDIEKVVANRNATREAYEDDRDVCYWEIQNDVFKEADDLLDIAETMRFIFLFIGLFFLLFSMLLFSSFISSSIANKRRDVGILRALGAKKSDVFKVFYSESLFLALFNIILATVFTFLFSGLINGMFSEGISYNLVVVSPNFLSILIVFLSSLLAASISTLLPVLKISKEEPINAINGK